MKLRRRTLQDQFYDLHTPGLIVGRKCDIAMQYIHLIKNVPCRFIYIQSGEFNDSTDMRWFCRLERKQKKESLQTTNNLNWWIMKYLFEIYCFFNPWWADTKLCGSPQAAKDKVVSHCLIIMWNHSNKKTKIIESANKWVNILLWHPLTFSSVPGVHIPDA